MATITTSILTNHRIDMSDPSQFLFQGGAVGASDVRFSWRPGNSTDRVLAIHGTEFTYAGSGDAIELASGAISRISLDVGNFNFSDTNGDLVITGTEGLIAGNIRKGDARLFWNEILKGADTFNLVGLAEVDIGLAPNLIFGDDFSCPNFLSNFADAGGADTIFGADNQFDLIGDVNEVRGGRIKLVLIPAEYTGGDDTIFSAITDQRVRIIGDANSVFADGGVTGGNDLLDVSLSTAINSLVAGDALRVFSFGALTGGDDDITLGTGGGGAGDVFDVSGSNAFVQGGNDVIGGLLLFCAGDVSVISSGTTAIVVNGGADRMNGSGAADTVAGDVLQRLSTDNTIAGGGDTITGGSGNDRLFGEVAFGGLAGVSGGDDRLNGGPGNDRLFGQTGDDVLVGGGGTDQLAGGAGDDLLRGGSAHDVLAGAAGDDRLAGDGGPDRYVFNPGSDADRIVGFIDEGGAGDDVIDARGYDFANRAAIGKSAAGTDLVLNLGGGNSITVAGYLATHAIADINGDILI